MSDAEDPPLNREQRRAAKKGASKTKKPPTHSPIEDLANRRKVSHPSSRQPTHGSVRTTGSQRGG